MGEKHTMSERINWKQSRNAIADNSVCPHTHIDGTFTVIINSFQNRENIIEQNETH